MNNLKFRLNKFYKLFRKTMTNPVMQVLPGQIAFFFLLSIFPIILLLVILSPIFSISLKNIIEIIKVSFPAETSKVIIPMLSGKSIDMNIIVLLVSTIWLVSRCTKSIIIAASNVYEIEDNNPIQNTVKSIIITVLFALLFIFIALISVFGGRILNLLSNFLSISPNIIKIYNILRWPITFFVIFILLKIIYTLAPNKVIKSKSVNYGSVFTTILWIIVTAIYSYYITHFSSYNILYGSTANLIILMLWVYLISYIFVLGMVFNASKLKYND